jgi:multidrug efflux pump subunit AcrA (membrane-fusion protein)
MMNGVRAAVVARTRSVGEAVRAPAFLVALLAVVGCGKVDKPEPPKPTPQAKVSDPVKEADLTTVRLTPEAEKRLLIPGHLGVAERRKLRRTRTYAGEIALIPGRSVIVSAPLPGTVEPVGGPLAPGAAVAKGRPMLKLTPMIPPERLIVSPGERLSLAEARASLRLRELELKAKLAADLAEAEGNVTRAAVLHDAAVIAQKRAEQLVRDKAAGARALDEARAATEAAKATLEAAKVRRDIIAATKLEAAASPTAEAGEVAAVTLESPMAGTLRDLRVGPGQKVTAGAPLFEVIDISAVWVRVPVPVGESAELAAGSSLTASVLPLNAGPREAASAVAAKPVPAPPSANPLSETVDLFFELPNAEGRFLPGQRVAAELPLKEEAESLTVPWGAVLYDIHGGAWVYENTAPQAFVRRRVQVRRVEGATAVLSDADLKPGAKVVTAGAAELFGVEFGVGK